MDMVASQTAAIAAGLARALRRLYLEPVEQPAGFVTK